MDDDFSMWYVVAAVAIILVCFMPVIIGIFVMGIQRSVLIKHSSSGLIKKGFYGYSWTYLVFGWLVPIFRGEIGLGAMHLFFTFITGGLFQLVMPYLYNRQFTSRQLTNGWVLADEAQNMQQARLRLKIAEPG
jgi:hypothetical protein